MVDIDCNSFTCWAYILIDFLVRSASSLYPSRPSVSVLQRAAIVSYPRWFLYGLTALGRGGGVVLTRDYYTPGVPALIFSFGLGGRKSLELFSTVHMLESIRPRWIWCHCGGALCT